MAIEGILFDLDGTLLDTLEDLADSLNEVLAEQGFPTHPVKAYKYFVGEGVEVMIRRALPEDRRGPEVLERSLEKMTEVYTRRWRLKTRLYPGIPELLDALTTRRLKMSILSNKVDFFTQIMVADLLSAWRFDRVLGVRPGHPKKPDPAGALEIARDLQLSPAQFLYLGDTPIDMKTAVAAGMFPIGVLWGFRPAEELRSGGARLLINHPLDLLPILDDHQ
ncbi:MAG: HAD family hydrolase [Deltaproteobacteria bacterium]|nr:HAD family hydrolase [Deltaproteobacteria bacterium]